MYTDDRLTAWRENHVYRLPSREIVAVYEDIGERVSAQRALAHAKDLLDRAQSISRVGGWEYDVASAHVTWTDEVYRIYGVDVAYDPNDLDAAIGFYAPESEPLVREAFGRAITDAEAYDIEVELDRADGERIWLRTVGQPIVENDVVVRVTGTILEITEAKLAEAALAESERRFRSLFESMAEGVALHELVVDERGAPVDYRILAVNPAYTAQTGVRAEEACGRLSRDVYGTDEPPYLSEYVHATLTGEPCRFQVFFEPLGKLFDITVVRQDASHFATVFEDITEQQRAEDQIRRLNIELEERVLERTAQLAAKNEELKGFAYTVSHDLKAPLRGIAGYADELNRRHREGLSERAEFCLSQVLSATRNMDHLIEDLLHYSRMDAETASLTDVELRGLVAAILRDRGLVIGEQHIDVTVDIPFATLRAWERGLLQVLANLIDNAIKFSRDANPPRLGIRAKESADVWTLSVSDNGIGFDMDYHDRIFGLFNRLVRAEEFDGTGAGLAIAKKVLEKQGGRIWAEAAPGQGATFFVELPRPVS